MTTHRPLRRDAAFALAFLLLVLAVYADPLFTHRNFIGRDILPYDLPLEKAVHDSWARGQIPVWWTSVSGGRPLMPNPNAGVFYPVRPLLSRVSFPVAMRWFPILHWILGGWGMLRLLRVIGGSRAAAWVAAVSFTFSGVIVSEVFYAVIHPGASLLPWSLWALARTTSRPIGRILPVAVVYGLMLLAGDAFSLVLALSSAALWILLEMPRADRARVTGSLLVGLIAAGLFALPQVLATALLAPETHRMIGGIKLREALDFSIPPARLLELAVPYPFGPSWSMDMSLDWGAAVFRRFFSTFFVGPIALVGLLVPFRDGPRGVRFARGLTLITLTLALSGHWIPDAWGNLASPVPLRYPEKFMLGAAFAMAVAAGLAVDVLRRRGSSATWILAVAAVLAMAAVAARLEPPAAGRLVGGAVGAPPALREEAARQLPAALAQAGLLWVATAIGAALLSRAGRTPLAGGLALLTLVPVASDCGIAQAAHEGSVFPPTPFARVVMQKDAEGAYRGLDESLYSLTSLRETSVRGDWGGSELYRQSWSYYTQSLWERGTVFNSDLDVGDFSRLESLRRVCVLAAGQSDSNLFFSSLSLRFGFRFRDQEPIAGFRPLGGDAFRIWDENPGAQPDIRLVESWREEAGPVPALASLPRLGPGQVVIETERSASGSARPGRVRILTKTPEALRLTTECPDPTWLFVLRGDWEYRTVLVDGHPATVRPAQLAFSAVAIPAGTHRVEWRENAPGLAVSRWGPVAALVLLGAVVARRVR